MKLRKYIKTVEKKIWAKKIFWTPLSEKTGAREEKTQKMTNFRPKMAKYDRQNELL